MKHFCSKKLLALVVACAVTFNCGAALAYGFSFNIPQLSVVDEGGDKIGDTQECTIGITIEEGQVADGNANFVTGGTVYQVTSQLQSSVDKANQAATDAADAAAKASTAAEQAQPMSGKGITAVQNTNATGTTLNINASDDFTFAEVEGNQQLQLSKATSVTEGSSQVVTSGAVWQALQDIPSASVTAGSGIKVSGSEVSLNADSADFTFDDTSKALKIKKDGQVTAGNTGLVTGGTVYDAIKNMGGDTETLKKRISSVESRVSDLDTATRQVGAHAAALSALHPLAYNPDAPTTFAAGVGTYRDEVSYAIGVFHYTSDRFMLNLGASVTQGAGDFMGRAGFSFSLGKSSKACAKSDKKEIEQLQLALADMQRSNTTLNYEYEKQKAELAELKSELADMRAYIKSCQEAQKAKQNKPQEQAPKTNNKTKKK